jgi:hypothetical protein
MPPSRSTVQDGPAVSHRRSRISQTHHPYQQKRASIHQQQNEVFYNPDIGYSTESLTHLTCHMPQASMALHTRAVQEFVSDALFIVDGGVLPVLISNQVERSYDEDSLRLNCPRIANTQSHTNPRSICSVTEFEQLAQHHSGMPVLDHAYSHTPSIASSIQEDSSSNRLIPRRLGPSPKLEYSANQPGYEQLKQIPQPSLHVVETSSHLQSHDQRFLEHRSLSISEESSGVSSPFSSDESVDHRTPDGLITSPAANIGLHENPVSCQDIQVTSQLSDLDVRAASENASEFFFHPEQYLHLLDGVMSNVPVASIEHPTIANHGIAFGPNPYESSETIDATNCWTGTDIWPNSIMPEEVNYSRHDIHTTVSPKSLVLPTSTISQSGSNSINESVESDPYEVSEISFNRLARLPYYPADYPSTGAYTHTGNNMSVTYNTSASDHNYSFHGSPRKSSSLRAPPFYDRSDEARRPRDSLFVKEMPPPERPFPREARSSSIGLSSSRIHRRINPSKSPRTHRQVDLLPRLAPNDAQTTSSPSASKRKIPARTIAATPRADPHRKESDKILVDCKRRGMSYKEIKAQYHWSEADSTLRGRYRNLTKVKDDRVRKPKWHPRDVGLQLIDFLQNHCLYK